jgi:hypothetical protein
MTLDVGSGGKGYVSSLEEYDIVESTATIEKKKHNGRKWT